MWFRMVILVPFGIGERFRPIQPLCDRLTAARHDLARQRALVQNKITKLLGPVALRHGCCLTATNFDAAWGLDCEPALVALNVES